uniref:VWFA domain-containing protein n=1 Tax=Plectus sambesii TaxID=2011161 RepID=A0A914XR27_9BILA
MAVEEYDVKKGIWIITKQNPIEILLTCFLTIAVIVAVVLSVIVLSKVNNASTTTSSNDNANPTSSSAAPKCTNRIHQDVVVMYDASLATGDLSLFKATNSYLRDTFFTDWSIGAAAQVAVIPFPNSDTFHDQSGFGDFGTARDSNDLQYLMTRHAQLLNNGTVQTSSSSDIISGLNATQKYLVGQLHDRPDARNTAIIFATSADGATDDAANIAYHMKRNFMFFLTVAVGSAANNTILTDQLASNGAYAFSIKDPSNLSDGQALARSIHDLLLTIPNGSICL